MFYILRTVDVPFAATAPEKTMAAAFESAADVTKELYEARKAYPNDQLELVEVLMSSGSRGITKAASDGSQAIPPELARAVEQWNSIASTTAPKLPGIRNVSNYVAAYRKWKKANVGRSYLLETAVEAVRAATWTHEFIEFGWLLRSSGGTFNTDKVLDGRARNFTGRARRAAGNGEEFAAREK